MHYSAVLLTSAVLIQGALSLGVSTFSGPDCTGDQYNVYLANIDTKENLPPFRSYRENGWGSKLYRIGFYESTDCVDNFLYDTWAYDGDYFKSHTCYNLVDHASELGYPFDTARCVKDTLGDNYA
ncbi:hypothetical protein PISL3812_05086 [Talaromyces islandicus]|uniref:Ecp2 effector protein domain-containing protein n=1 Tax=Talaromyces islandicus TaxID=28573 RepID=A0A0U1LZB8_TALIS|nr:hypothetical protein PISL3812_05086 [Talaromyces islandicus]